VTPALSTRAVIGPIIFDTYGDGAMAQALVDWIMRNIEGVEPVKRERFLMLACWDWFPGGTTAESVARKLEEALR